MYNLACYLAFASEIVVAFFFIIGMVLSPNAIRKNVYVAYKYLIHLRKRCLSSFNYAVLLHFRFPGTSSSVAHELPHLGSLKALQKWYVRFECKLL